MAWTNQSPAWMQKGPFAGASAAFNTGLDMALAPLRAEAAANEVKKQGLGIVFQGLQNRMEAVKIDEIAAESSRWSQDQEKLRPWMQLSPAERLGSPLPAVSSINGLKMVNTVADNDAGWSRTEATRDYRMAMEEAKSERLKLDAERLRETVANWKSINESRKTSTDISARTEEGRALRFGMRYDQQEKALALKEQQLEDSKTPRETIKSTTPSGAERTVTGKLGTIPQEAPPEPREKKDLRELLGKLKAAKAAGKTKLDVDQLMKSKSVDLSPWWGGGTIDQGIAWIEAQLDPESGAVRPSEVSAPSFKIIEVK